MSTTRIIDIGGSAVIVEFERKRVKNINVRVRRDGSLYASMPYWVSYAEAERFIVSKSSFFKKALDDTARRNAAEESWKNIDGESVEKLKSLIKELIDLHMPYFAARVVEKNLINAIANANQKWGATAEELKVVECYINPGVVLKRIKFASRGNVDRRDKRTSHITVKVSDNKEVSKKGKEGA